MTNSKKLTFKQRLYLFQHDHSGIAAVEFAIIAPIMLMMYFGLAEIATLISTDRRVSAGANVAGDMIAQAPESSREDAQDILSAAVRVMNVREGSLIQMDIESFILNSSGEVESRGRVLLNYSAPPERFDASALDPRLLSQNSGVVVTRVKYPYTTTLKTPPTMNRVAAEGSSTVMDTRRSDGPVTLRETFLLKPRRSEFVDIAPVVVGGIRLTNTQTLCEGPNYANLTCQATTIVPQPESANTNTTANG